MSLNTEQNDDLDPLLAEKAVDDWRAGLINRAEFRNLLLKAVRMEPKGPGVITIAPENPR